MGSILFFCQLVSLVRQRFPSSLLPLSSFPCWLLRKPCCSCYYYFDFILKRFVIADIVIFCSYFNLLIIIVLSLSLNEYICAVFRRHMYRKLDFNLIFLSHFISHISQHTSVIWNIYLNEQMTDSLGPPTQEGYMKVVIHNKSETLSFEKEYHNREDHRITKTWHRGGIFF